MLTVDFDKFPITKGEKVLDMGCGFGRHAFALLRQGADVVALDYSQDARPSRSRPWACSH